MTSVISSNESFKSQSSSVSSKAISSSKNVTSSKISSTASEDVSSNVKKQSKIFPISYLQMKDDRTGKKITIGMTKKEVEKIFPSKNRPRGIDRDYGNTEDVHYEAFSLKYIDDELVCIYTDFDDEGHEHITYGPGLKVNCTFDEFKKAYGKGIHFAYPDDDNDGKRDSDIPDFACYYFKIISSSEVKLISPKYVKKNIHNPKKMKNIYAVCADSGTSRYASRALVFAIYSVEKYNYFIAVKDVW